MFLLKFIITNLYRNLAITYMYQSVKHIRWRDFLTSFRWTFTLICSKLLSLHTRRENKFWVTWNYAVFTVFITRRTYHKWYTINYYVQFCNSQLGLQLIQEYYINCISQLCWLASYFTTYQLLRIWSIKLDMVGWLWIRRAPDT